MGGCSAVGCSNSAKKGFLMKRLPKNPIRRQQWILKIKRDKNWQPNDDTRLCEVHFAPEMWEKTRVDGKRVLRSDAVPTIFPSSKSTLKRKAPTQGSPLKLQSVQESNQTVDYGIIDPEPSTSAAYSSDVITVILDDNIGESPPSNLTASTSAILAHKDCKAKFLRYEKMYTREREKSSRRYKTKTPKLKI
ncbi:hypothetical protein PPYR_01496 [Photinus pyralis]|uniref:THAP-type domain-containing protein n=1 Tax=Photinus pyralis TaxID=7054 RepID=A0A1Y1KC96_PHOPY|nr:THAP domain-containing protein 4-like [Photinus pyralis]XP_031353540.1 THAP domain-containing protein 4-like [Photinus pyralis]KAB0804526.1 hypothetical protein PPYR_01496 [Photinus pyralis]